MLFWTYNLSCLVGLPFVAAYLAIKSYFYKKRSLSSFFVLPKIHKFSNKTIWIHAVSLGEVNTSKPLIETLRKQYKDSSFIITTVTETGLKAASSIEGVQAMYMPFDLVWLQRKLINLIDPKLVIYIEGDLWPSLIHVLSRKKIPQILVSAKISMKSYERLKNFPCVVKLLYGPLAAIGAQDDEMMHRFKDLGLADISVTGNLKLAKATTHVLQDDKDRVLNFLKLDSSKKTLLVASTHRGEEELILKSLGNSVNNFNLIFAPRHPQRFDEVFAFLKKKLPHLVRLSQAGSLHSNAFFIDAIGLLSMIYPLADVTILGGSFVEKIGGHNLLEPVFEGCPVITGPYLHSQSLLKNIVTENQLGLVVDPADLLFAIEGVLSDKYFKTRACRFSTSSMNLKHTLDLIEKNFLSEK